MNPLVSLYENILKAMGMHINEKGMISMSLDDQLFPCSCSQKSLVLPIQEVLRASQWGTQMAFHPISENIVRGPSPVLTKTNMLITFRLTSIITEVMLALMELAADKNKHSQISPVNVGLLKALPDVNEKTVDALMALLNNIEVEGDKKLVNVYLRRAGSLNGRNYSRAAIVTFPILTEFKEPHTEVYGVKMRVMDKEAIVALFNWIFPEGDKVETYSAGSSSLVAPYFDSLIRAFINVANRLNTVIERFAGNIPELNKYYIDLSWATELENLPRFKDLIPVLEGNEGEVGVGTTANESTPATARAAELARQIAAGAATTTVTTVAPAAPEAPKPPKPYDPRAINITTSDFKPLGGATINVDRPNEVIVGGGAPQDDWNRYLDSKMVQTNPMPVFAAVGGPPVTTNGYGLPNAYSAPVYAAPAYGGAPAYGSQIYGAPVSYGYGAPPPTGMPTFARAN